MSEPVIMAGWAEEVEALYPWAEEVEALYLRSEEMEVAEFEALLSVALTGERPDHPGLPAYLPIEKGIFLPHGWKYQSWST